MSAPRFCWMPIPFLGIPADLGVGRYHGGLHSTVTAGDFESLPSFPAGIAQWIVYRSPKPVIWVRFPVPVPVPTPSGLPPWARRRRALPSGRRAKPGRRRVALAKQRIAVATGAGGTGSAAASLTQRLPLKASPRCHDDNRTLGTAGVIRPPGIRSPVASDWEKR